VDPTGGFGNETPKPTVSGVGEILAGSFTRRMTPSHPRQTCLSWSLHWRMKSNPSWTPQTHHQNRKRLILGPKTAVQLSIIMIMIDTLKHYSVPPNSAIKAVM